MICPYEIQCEYYADRDRCNNYFEICVQYAWHIEDTVLGFRDERTVESGFKKLLEAEAIDSL